MKSVITLFFLLFNFCLYSQDNGVRIDVVLMSKAAAYSKSGAIGVFIIAGNEFDDMTDIQINEAFDRLMKGTSIDIEIFIQRTDVRNGSTMDFFVDGGGVGETVLFRDSKPVLREAIKVYRENRGLPTNK